MNYKTPSKIDIGNDIRFVRRSLGLTQLELAEHLDINRATLASWETGKNEVPATIYKQIVQLFPH